MSSICACNRKLLACNLSSWLADISSICKGGAVSVVVEVSASQESRVQTPDQAKGISPAETKKDRCRQGFLP